MPTSDEKRDKPEEAKGKFSRFKELIERMREKFDIAAEKVVAVFSRRTVAATCAALAIAVTPAYGCEEENTPTDAQEDAGGHEDVLQEAEDSSVDDTAVDEGSEAGPTLCELYGEDDPHSLTFELKVAASPGEGTYYLMFLKLEPYEDRMIATFMGNFAGSPSTTMYRLTTGVQRSHDIPGLGPTRFEACEATPEACDGTPIPPTGDPNCTVRVVCESGW